MAETPATKTATRALERRPGRKPGTRPVVRETGLSASTHPVLGLQRQAGNRALQGLIRGEDRPAGVASPELTASYGQVPAPSTEGETAVGGPTSAPAPQPADVLPFPESQSDAEIPAPQAAAETVPAEPAPSEPVPSEPVPSEPVPSGEPVADVTPAVPEAAESEATVDAIEAEPRAEAEAEAEAGAVAAPAPSGGAAGPSAEAVAGGAAPDETPAVETREQAAVEGAPAGGAARGGGGAAGGGGGGVAAGGAARGGGGGAPGGAPADVEMLMPEPPGELSPEARDRLGGAQAGAGRAAAAEAELPTAAESTAEARGAVTEPATETAGRAESALMTALDERPGPSPEIEKLCQRIRKIIRSKRPPDEESLVEAQPDEMAREAGGQVEGSVEGDVERVGGSYDEMATPPEGTPAQVGEGMEAPPESVPAPEIGAAGAAPDEIPPEDVSLEADAEASQQRMDEAGMTSEPAELVQEGPIAEAREAQGELDETAARGPAEVLAEQRETLARTRADMAALQEAALQALEESRRATVAGTTGRQRDMVGSEELTRESVSARAQAIYQRAQSRVETLLEPLTRNAMARWEAGKEVLATRFKQRLARVAAWIEERHGGTWGWITAAVDWLVGLPGWVTAEYDAAEQQFGDGVCDLIREISTEVNSVVAACEAIIEGARREINQLFDSLPEDLREWAAGEQERLQGQLDGLRDRVTETRDGFNRDLARSASEAVDEVRREVHELRQAAGGLLGQVMNAVNRFLEDPAKFIIEGLLTILGISPAAFWALVARIEQVIDDIADDPLAFAGNLLSALGKGFQQFFDNIVDHLLEGLLDWLFSGLGSVGVSLPADFSLKSIITFFLQLMGITWPRIRRLLAKHIGEENVALIEKAYELISTLIELGPEGVFEMIKERLNPQEILDQVLQAAVDFLVEALIRAVSVRIIALFNPVGAILQAIEAIYRVLKWIFDNAARIFSLVETVVGGIADILAGNIGGMANAVESALSRLIAPVIDFLAGFLGLGNLPDRIADVIRGFQQTVERVLDRVIGFLADRARALLRAVGIGPEQEEMAAEGEGGVKGRARGLLAERLGAGKPVSEVEQVVRQIRHQLAPEGLVRLELGEPSSEGVYPVLAEASPIEELMQLAPEEAHVTLGVTVRLKAPRRGQEPLPPTEGIHRVTGFYEPQDEDKEILGDRQVASLSPVSAPPRMAARDPRATRPSGALLIEPEEDSRELQIVAWSTGSPIRGSNVSHAERQFVEWLEDQEDWLRRVEHIGMVLTHSPCGDCTAWLVGAMGTVRIWSPNATGHITWSDLHRGSQATSASDISRLRDAGWTVAGPMPSTPTPTPPIRRRRRS